MPRKEPYTVRNPIETPQKLPIVSIKPLPKRILYTNQRIPKKSPSSTKKIQKEPCVSAKDTPKRALYIIGKATKRAL